MKKIYYEKVGRRYLPVAEYDSEFFDRLHRGNHLIMCYPGGVSRRFNVDPDYAALIAAGRVAEDAMTRAINEASKLGPTKKPLTDEQRAAWDALADSFGDDLATLTGKSCADIARAGIEALQREADVLLSNPVVRKAYDHFILIAELTKEHHDVDD
jgi:hypothetical protein